MIFDPNPGEFASPAARELMRALHGATDQRTADQRNEGRSTMETKTTDPGDYQMLPVAALVESPTNPRQRYGDMTSLVESVRAHGVITPLLVRPIPASFNGNRGPKFVAHKGAEYVTRYEIVAGHRRLRAAKQAGLEEVPVIVKALDQRQTLELQIIENLQREDVHPIEEAAGYQRLLDEDHGYAVEELAKRVGKSVSYVYQRLKLGSLIPAATKAFLEDQITASHAILIARENAENQKGALQYATGPHPPSVRAFEDWIQREFYRHDLAGAPWKKDEAALLARAGACTSCPKRTGANPELYPELKQGKDICQDAACFAAKGQALVKQILAAEPEAVPVRVGYASGSDAKLRRAFPKLRVVEPRLQARKNDPGAKPGIVVEAGGYAKLGVGQRLWFVSKQAQAAQRSATTPAAKEAKRKARQAQERAAAKRQADEHARAAVVRAIVAKAPAFPGERELRLVAKQLWDGRYDDALAKRYGVEARPENPGALDKLMRARIDAWGSESLTPFVVELLAADAAEPGWYGEQNPLAALARAYKVDAKQVEKAAAAEYTRLQKAAAKPKPPAKAKAKRAGQPLTAGAVVHKLHTGAALTAAELRQLQTQGSAPARKATARRKAKAAGA